MSMPNMVTNTNHITTQYVYFYDEQTIYIKNITGAQPSKQVEKEIHIVPFPYI